MSIQSINSSGSGAVYPLQPGNINVLPTTYQKESQDAAKTVGEYMIRSGQFTIDPNQIWKLAFNAGNNIPEDVQKAAQYILDNPDVLAIIEKRNGVDNALTSDINSFLQAGEGKINFDKNTPLSDKYPMDKDEAATTMEAYRKDKQLSEIDTNKLFELATNRYGGVPDDLQRAAIYTLKHTKELYLEGVARMAEFMPREKFPRQAGEEPYFLKRRFYP